MIGKFWLDLVDWNDNVAAAERDVDDDDDDEDDDGGDDDGPMELVCLLWLNNVDVFDGEDDDDVDGTPIGCDGFDVDDECCEDGWGVVGKGGKNNDGKELENLEGDELEFWPLIIAATFSILSRFDADLFWLDGKLKTIWENKISIIFNQAFEEYSTYFSFAFNALKNDPETFWNGEWTKGDAEREEISRKNAFRSKSDCILLL